MKLHIENFAKISSADILFDGFTVIAGKNNTGKSTLGKVLYVLFRSMSQLDRRIRQDRIRSIVNAFKKATDFKISNGQAEALLEGDVTAEDLYGELMRGAPEYEKSIEAIFGASHMLSAIGKQQLNSEIQQIQSTADSAIAARLTGKVLDCVFHHQFTPLKGEKAPSKIALTVKGQTNSMTISDVGFEVIKPTSFVNRVQLVASPDVLSLINVRDIEVSEKYERAFDKYTLELAQSLVKKSSLSATEEEALQAKLKDVYTELDHVIGGEFKLDRDNEFSLYEHGNDRPTKAENLSMGMKSFVLLRHMLQQGVLQDRDVLILDEPENHLHPTLQIVYAKILVLLQKKFDLTVLMTSHSAFFVNAVQRFCLRELQPGVAHFYLSKEDAEHPGFMTFEDRSAGTGPIFRGFNEAYALVDALSDGGEIYDDTLE